MARFKVDENLPSEVAELLKNAGHDAMTVYQQEMAGIQDPELISICKKESRVLLTLDLDFSNIRTYPPEDYMGIIVLRLHYQSKPHVINSVKKILSLIESEPIERNLWIVEESSVRIHDRDREE